MTRYLFLYIKMISVFNEHNKMRFGVIQLLVQKYIEIESKLDNVFLYSELNYDIDAFNARLENVEKLRSVITPPTIIEAFIEEISDEHASSMYLLMFKNIHQLISKHSYQENMNLWLILVPTSDSFDIKVFQEQFMKLKEEISSISEIQQKLLFDELLYNKTLHDKTVIDAITLTLAKIYKGKLNIDKIKISDADYQMVKKNLFKTQIRVITLNELLEMELDKDFIKRFMFSQV